MKEAHDHSRVSPEGKAVGIRMARGADIYCAELAKGGEPDERCKTCAFRAGTVPNGCLQTQADAGKAICEGVPFLCHAHRDASGKYYKICHGYFAVRCAAKLMAAETGQELPAAAWDFSPNEVES